MKILKTLLAFSDSDPGKIFSCDTIEMDGKFWLVPDWIENYATRKSKPIRIICLDYLPHQKTGADEMADFVLNVPIPKCVFDGEIPSETTLNFHIVEDPEIFFDNPKKSNLH